MQRGFQSRCFGTRPLLDSKPFSVGQRRAEARGWAGTALLTKPLWCFSALSFKLQLAHLFQQKVSLSSGPDYCEVRSAARHCCPCSQLPTDSDWAYCIHAFSVDPAAGGGKAMWGILIKACSAWRVLAGRQRNRGLTLALFVILSSIAHTEGVTSIHDDTW